MQYAEHEGVKRQQLPMCGERVTWYARTIRMSAPPTARLMTDRIFLTRTSVTPA
jgi:hypothetical protein